MDNLYYRKPTFHLARIFSREQANKQVTAGGDVVSFCRQPITHCLEMITKCEPRD